LREDVVETAVLRHLFAHYYRDTPQIQYWRDSKTGKEVDIIIGSPKYTIPVEVKYRSKAPLNRNEGIVLFCYLLGQAEQLLWDL